MRINNNLMAMNTHRQLGINSGNGAKAIEKLSSGYRINRAGDDAAGLAISEKMRAQIRGLNQASRNSQDAISLVQTAEGALNESQAILQRMRELAVQSANDTNVDSDRSEIQKEINQLTSEINRIGNTTEFNTQKLLNGGEERSGSIRHTEKTAGNSSTGSATGGVTGVNVSTASVAAGTVAIAGFKKTTSSSVEANGGSIGSPLTEVTKSVKGGTGAISGDNAVESTAGVAGAAIVAGSVDNIVQGASAAKFSFEVDINAENGDIKVGDGIKIGSKVYTAGTADDVANNRADFEVGADNDATIAKLKDVLDSDTDIQDEDGNNVTVTISGGKLKFEVDANDKAMKLGTEAISKTASAADIAAKIETDSVAAVYTMEITKNFTADDTIEIGGQTFTAGTTNSANTFKVGSTIAETVSNLKTAFNMNTTLNPDYVAEVGSPDWSSDTNSLTIRKKAAGADAANKASFTTGVAVTPVTTTKGEYKFEIASNFDVGEKFEINGKTFTAVKAGDGNTATTFEVGSDFNVTASNLKTALEANTDLAGKFDISIGSGLDADTITLTEKTASGKSMNDVVGTVRDIDVAEVKGEYSVEITKNFAKGDEIEIDGKTYTAVAADATPSAGEFKIGASIDATVTNLVSAINADAGSKYTATKANTTFGTGDKLVLSEKVASGKDLISSDVTATKETAVNGVFEFQVSAQFSEGDRLAIDGVGLIAGDHFAVGSDLNDTAANIKTAIEANDDLKDKYTVAVSGNQLTLTEKSASGTELAAPMVSKDSVAGEYSFSIVEQTKGSSIEIDGKKLTFATGGSAKDSAAELKTLIEAETTLNSKYSVEVNDNEITLTQKTGKESETNPEIKYTVAAGSGFNATMQIGANTGQSMNVTMGDMRADSLNVSSSNGDDYSVTVDGKDLEVAWTETKTVTSGTEDIGTEYALDVSNSKNATVAVTVINDAINQVSGERSKLGAFQNRLEHTIKNLDTSAENLQASESRIRDVDMAKEMMTFTKNNILQQAAQSMLAQANQAPQGVLQLLR